MSKKDLLAKGLDNIANMNKLAETERLKEQENTEQKTERRTATTEVQKPLSTKVNRTANGDKNPVNLREDATDYVPMPPTNKAYPAQETPNTTPPSEPTTSERERVLQNLKKNPTNRKRPTVALKGRAKDARTYREAFQMTADLGKKLDDYIKATNGNKSEFIRRAIARELGKVKDDM